MVQTINLVLPKQSSVYSDLYNVYYDLFLGLNKLNIKARILLTKVDERNTYPQYDNNVKIEEISLEALDELLKDGNVYVLPDDFSLLKKIKYENLTIKNYLIWAHYFYGHRFLFKKYRDLPYRNYGVDRKYTLIEYLPIKFAYWSSKFYVSALKGKPIVAQSLWTLLLLERVYNLPVLGLLRIPVEASLYPLENDKESSALIYLGSKEDTDLEALYHTLKVLKEVDKDIKFDSFGNEHLARIVSQHYKVNYLGKLNRRELNEEYGKHLLTISPIYNGNFEMVPIQSLLCGTPVITFIQPFMEVTGESQLIANIEYVQEIRNKIKLWKNDIKDLRITTRKKILEEMDNEVVAKKLVYDYLMSMF